MYMLQDAAQAAFSFMVQQASIIEPQVYEIQYPEIQYPALIPIETSGDPWAKMVTFFSLDRVGQANWFHHMANDVPFADIIRQAYTQPIELAAVGYYYTVEEVQQAQRANLNLSVERAAAANRAYEEFMERIAFLGDSTKNWTGLINDAAVTVVDAPADGTGSSPLWANKTADQIIRDVNTVLTGIYTGSSTIEQADTLLVPPDRFTTLANTRVGDTPLNAMSWLQQYNTYTALTGQQLTIRAVRGLETAGVGGVARAVAYRRDPAIVRLHLPMPHQFLAPMQVAPLRFDVPGIFRTGGVEIRRPGSMRYLDKI